MQDLCCIRSKGLHNFCGIRSRRLQYFSGIRRGGCIISAASDQGGCSISAAFDQGGCRISAALDHVRSIFANNCSKPKKYMTFFFFYHQIASVKTQEFKRFLKTHQH